ncbi:COP9 signalosome complex subunit 8 isoform X2 [Castor canadensis]|uniref:COP9 signalosome complex subunit 8 isoform X2 n=2 Tax=Castor canadensis TaxID=51338 RepID=A0AC58MFJ2_CASCN
MTCSLDRLCAKLRTRTPWATRSRSGFQQGRPALQSTEPAGQSARAPSRSRRRLMTRRQRQCACAWALAGGREIRQPCTSSQARRSEGHFGVRLSGRCGSETGREDASGGDGGKCLQFQKVAGSVREPGARGILEQGWQADSTTRMVLPRKPGALDVSFNRFIPLSEPAPVPPIPNEQQLARLTDYVAFLEN